MAVPELWTLGSKRHHMAFQLFAPWHLKAGIFLFSLFAVLGLAGVIWAGHFDYATANGVEIPKTDPRFAQEVSSFRLFMGMFGLGSVICAQLCYWGWRKFRP